jgi:hypothetical protein
MDLAPFSALDLSMRVNVAQIRKTGLQMTDEQSSRLNSRVVKAFCPPGHSNVVWESACELDIDTPSAPSHTENKLNIMRVDDGSIPEHYKIRDDFVHTMIAATIGVRTW